MLGLPILVSQDVMHKSIGYVGVFFFSSKIIWFLNVFLLEYPSLALVHSVRKVDAKSVW